MEFMSRGRRLFQYGDLEGDTRTTSSADSASAGGDIETERSGIVSSSANSRMRSSRRCLWVGSLIAVIIAIIIIAAAVQNRQHLRAAAEALMQSMDEAEVTNIRGDSSNSDDVTLERDRGGGLNGKQRYSFADFVSLAYYPEEFNGTWVGDTEILFRDQYGGLSITNVATGSTSTVVRVPLYFGVENFEMLGKRLWEQI